jgi:hypothetical protein
MHTSGKHILTVNYWILFLFAKAAERYAACEHWIIFDIPILTFKNFIPFDLRSQSQQKDGAVFKRSLASIAFERFGTRPGHLW